LRHDLPFETSCRAHRPSRRTHRSSAQPRVRPRARRRRRLPADLADPAVG